MNIRNVRNKFKHFKTASISQLAATTGESITDLEFVFKELLLKGKIEKFDTQQLCNSGCSCSSSKATQCSTTDQLYTWIE